MTLVEGLIRVLLKAVLYSGVLLGAIVLDMYYDSVMPANVCIGNAGPGYWDCHLARRITPAELDTLDAVGAGLR